MLGDVRLLLLGLWLGAAIFFSAVVAPSAFSVTRAFQLPNASEIAGGIVTRTLSVINISGFIVSILLLASAFGLRRPSSRLGILELALVAIVAITTGAGQWLIAARMQSLRLAAGVPLDQLSPDHPTRLAFNSLHSYSVKALAVGIIAALIAFFLIAYRARLNS